MITATIIESPDGERVVLSSNRWGTADVSERTAHRTGIEDLWNAASRGSIRGHSARPEPGILTYPAPVSFSIMEMPTGIYGDWHTVAVVDDTEGEHLRVFPERIVGVARRYLALDAGQHPDEQA